MSGGRRKGPGAAGQERGRHTNLTQKDFGVIVKELEQLGENIGVIIKCQKEEIFNQMHRI